MTIDANLKEFGGLPVVEYKPGDRLDSPAKQAIRISVDWDDYEEGKGFSDLFAPLLEEPGIGELAALVVGDWGGSAEGNDAEPVVEALVAAAERLPKLASLFLAEMTFEESEISWINQADVGPLFAAYPELTELFIRGGNGLSLGRPAHDRLTKLVIETGGLPGSVVREVAAANLPQLEHLELWLGDTGYGRDVTSEDLGPILAGDLFPMLKYLGLRNDEEADATAALVAAAPIISQLEVLDLSLGTLGDEGAEALAKSEAIKSLRRLDVNHHYVSDALVKKLQECGPEIDASDRKEPDNWDGEDHRYCAVSE